MMSLKLLYYLLAVKINLTKVFKKIYFSTGFYKKSLISKTPSQFFFFPNPFLISHLSNYKKFAFQINNLDPDRFWDQNFSNKEKGELHNFLWLSSIDRKDNPSTLRKIISLWNESYLRYKTTIWETSIISKRIISWILNADLILKIQILTLKEILLNQLLFKPII